MARKKTAHLDNVHIHQESFQQLPFPAASFDVVYVVESLCYATDMPRALSEARRVLRPGGTMIVIDGWRTGAFEELPDVAQRAAVLAERAMSVGNPWIFPDWLGQARRHRLELIEDVDFGPSIMPNLRRFERMATRYFHHLSLARLSARVLPAKMLSNAIAGYLMPSTVRVGAHTYRMISLRASGALAA
jgi:SAM-dependent methyltransferase